MNLPFGYPSLTSSEPWRRRLEQAVGRVRGCQTAQDFEMTPVAQADCRWRDHAAFTMRFRHRQEGAHSFCLLLLFPSSYPREPPVALLATPSRLRPAPNPVSEPQYRAFFEKGFFCHPHVDANTRGYLPPLLRPSTYDPRISVQELLSALVAGLLPPAPLSAAGLAPPTDGTASDEGFAVLSLLLSSPPPFSPSAPSLFVPDPLISVPFSDAAAASEEEEEEKEEEEEEGADDAIRNDLGDGEIDGGGDYDNGGEDDYHSVSEEELWDEFSFSFEQDLKISGMSQVAERRDPLDVMPEAASAEPAPLPVSGEVDLLASHLDTLNFLSPSSEGRDGNAGRGREEVVAQSGGRRGAFAQGRGTRGAFVQGGKSVEKAGAKGEGLQTEGLRTSSRQDVKPERRIALSMKEEEERTRKNIQKKGRRPTSPASPSSSLLSSAAQKNKEFEKTITSIKDASRSSSPNLLRLSSSSTPPFSPITSSSVASVTSSSAALSSSSYLSSRTEPLGIGATMPAPMPPSLPALSSPISAAMPPSMPPAPRRSGPFAPIKKLSSPEISAPPILTPTPSPVTERPADVPKPTAPKRQTGIMGAFTSRLFKKSKTQPFPLASSSSTNQQSASGPVSSGETPPLMVCWYRAKVLVVGQENVGKTTLIKALKKRRRFQLKDRDGGFSLSTDGIDIHRVSVVLKDNKFTFSIFDFAGQELYYSSHQFFLTKERSIYLVAFDCRDLDANLSEDSRLLYWLNSIRIHAGQSVEIIAVGTHLDTFSDVSPVKALFQKLSVALLRFRIGHFFAVSGTAGLGVPELKKTLAQVAQADPEMQKRVPKSFVDFERQLLEMRATKVSHGEAPVCSVSQLYSRISEPHDLPMALSLLHNLGVVLHWGSTKPSPSGRSAMTQSAPAVSPSSHPRRQMTAERFPHAVSLEELVILDTQWVIDLMASIITTRHRFGHANGRLSAAELRQLWLGSGEGASSSSSSLQRPTAKFPEALHPALLALLESFELLVAMPDACYLVPSLLPPTAPDFYRQMMAMHQHPRYTRFYALPFLPLGVMPRLLARLLQHPLDPICIWRSGALLRSPRQPGFFVELSLDTVQATCCLRVQLYPEGADEAAGTESDGARLFRLCSGTVHDLLRFCYDGLLVSSITSACPSCRNPFAFDFEECAVAVAFSCGSVECPHCGRVASVGQLAPDLALVDLASLGIPSSSDVRIERELARGAFGIVALASYRDQQVAVKRLLSTSGHWGGSAPDNPPSVHRPAISASSGSRSGSSSSAVEAITEFVHEVLLLTQASHPGVVELIGYSLCPPTLVMEYLAEGSLFSLLHPSPDSERRVALRGNWRLLCLLGLNIARAMAFLHSLSPPILHLDLKSPNVLVASLATIDAAKITASSALAKIADFGLSRILYFEEVDRISSVENPIWRCPEGLETKAADVFSFGIMMYELASSCVPYHEHHFDFNFQLQEAIRTGLRPSEGISTSTPSPFLVLMHQAWNPDPSQRPTFHTLVSFFEVMFLQMQSHVL